MDWAVKTWTARIFLIVPILSSLYCIQTILESSQGNFSKLYQVLWFALAIFIRYLVYFIKLGLEILFKSAILFHFQCQCNAEKKDGKMLVLPVGALYVFLKSDSL